MKKTFLSARFKVLAVLVALLPFSATNAQSPEPVYSVSVIGFQKVPLAQNLQMLSNPFESMTIRELVGNRGVHGANDGVADNVILYDAVAQDYVTYYLRSVSSIGYPEWRRGTMWATNVYIRPGQGFFYRSRLSAVRTNTAIGDVVLDDAVTNTIQPGLQLLSYPYSTRVRLSDLNLKNGIHGANDSVADNAILYDFATQDYVTYYLRSVSSIGHPEWRRGTAWATNVYIEVGQGFFFRSRMPSPYQWIEQTPYPDL